MHLSLGSNAAGSAPLSSLMVIGNNAANQSIGSAVWTKLAVAFSDVEARSRTGLSWDGTNKRIDIGAGVNQVMLSFRTRSTTSENQAVIAAIARNAGGVYANADTEYDAVWHAGGYVHHHWPAVHTGIIDVSFGDTFEVFGYGNGAIVCNHSVAPTHTQLECIVVS